LATFLPPTAVEITARCPAIWRKTSISKRGKGVFESSLAGLRQLNALGYGRAASGNLTLNLVYNPLGTQPATSAGKVDWRPTTNANSRTLRHRLQPIVGAGQHADPTLWQSMLISKGQFNRIWTCKSAHRDENFAAVMCRNLHFSVDWQGYVLRLRFQPAC
jgi:hypothetical protein